jgi:FkbM family methyltransferase
MPRWLEDAVQRVAGADDSTRRVRWHQDGKVLEFDVPGDNVWVCIKDDLLLREYDWMGIGSDVHRDLVVDGGAHVGTFTADVARATDKVVAVEAHPTTAQLLRGNVERNGLHQVEVVEAALWPERGTVSFQAEGQTSSASVMTAGPDDVAVATLTLPDLVAEHGPVDLLKLDVEGAEHRLVHETDDATFANIGSMVGELHLWAGGEQAERDFVRRLEQLGYQVEVRQLPIHHPVESIKRMRAHAGDLEGYTRLKLTVAGVYAVTGLVDPIIGLRKHLNARDLRLFRAWRA